MVLKIGHLHVTYVFAIILAVKVLDSQSRGPGSKPKVSSDFPPSKVN